MVQLFHSGISREEDSRMGKIQVVKKNNSIFFQIEGDVTEFYDLDNLKFNHPELAEEIDKSRLMLERVLLQQKELKNAYDDARE